MLIRWKASPKKNGNLSFRRIVPSLNALFSPLENLVFHLSIFLQNIVTMTTALVSPKFRVVIPKEIRQALGLKPGQRLQFVEKGGRVEIRPILTPDQLIGFLKRDKPLKLEREPDRKL